MKSSKLWIALVPIIAFFIPQKRLHSGVEPKRDIDPKISNKKYTTNPFTLKLFENNGDKFKILVHGSHGSHVSHGSHTSHVSSSTYSASPSYGTYTSPTIPTAKESTPFVTPGGSFNNECEVTISVPYGSSVRYTLDGSTPTQINGTLLTSNAIIKITKTTRLKAIAYSSIYLDSDIRDEFYVIKNIKGDLESGIKQITDKITGKIVIPSKATTIVVLPLLLNGELNQEYYSLINEKISSYLEQTGKINTSKQTNLEKGLSQTEISLLLYDSTGNVNLMKIFSEVEYLVIGSINVFNNKVQAVVKTILINTGKVKSLDTFTIDL